MKKKVKKQNKSKKKLSKGQKKTIFFTFFTLPKIWAVFFLTFFASLSQLAAGRSGEKVIMKKKEVRGNLFEQNKRENGQRTERTYYIF